MKISKLFHWLYASVMMLPLVVAPIFALAVRSDNNFQHIEIQVDDYKLVDFNQKQENGDFNLSDVGYLRIRSTLTLNDNVLNVVVDNASSSFKGVRSTSLLFNENNVNHVFYTSVYANCNKGSLALGQVYNSSTSEVSTDLEIFTHITNRFSVSVYNGNYGYFSVYYSPDTTSEVVQAEFNITDLFIIDLTQMFGVGNEPSKEYCDSYFSNSYYDYILSRKELLNVGSVTYNDTDLGSQFLYSMYKPINEYFNVTNFLGLNNLYSWININVFNGVASLGFCLLYMLLSYWLLVSIFWLVFDVVMYVPNLAHRWLDKGSLQ